MDRWDDSALRAMAEDLCQLGPGDEDLVLGLLDAKIEWLRNRGYRQQWGTLPFSASSRRIRQVQGWMRSGGALLLGPRDSPDGVLVLGEAPDYVAPATVPELYVTLLVGGSTSRSAGAGRRLLDLAAELASGRGAERLRVDCFAGNDGRLVRYYEECGFSRAGTFDVAGWPGVVLTRSVCSSGARGGPGER